MVADAGSGRGSAPGQGYGGALAQEATVVQAYWFKLLTWLHNVQFMSDLALHHCSLQCALLAAGCRKCVISVGFANEPNTNDPTSGTKHPSRSRALLANPRASTNAIGAAGFVTACTTRLRHKCIPFFYSSLSKFFFPPTSWSDVKRRLESSSFFAIWRCI